VDVGPTGHTRLTASRCVRFLALPLKAPEPLPEAGTALVAHPSDYRFELRCRSLARSLIFTLPLLLQTEYVVRADQRRQTERGNLLRDRLPVRSS